MPIYQQVDIDYHSIFTKSHVQSSEKAGQHIWVATIGVHVCHHHRERLLSLGISVQEQYGQATPLVEHFIQLHPPTSHNAYET